MTALQLHVKTHQKRTKKISSQKALVFQGFLLSKGRFFIVRICRCKIGFFSFLQVLNSYINTLIPYFSSVWHNKLTYHKHLLKTLQIISC